MLSDIVGFCLFPYFLGLFGTKNIMDCELLHDILRVSFTMRAHQKFQDNLNLDFKMKPTFWQPWLDTGTDKVFMHKSSPRFLITFL